MKTNKEIKEICSWLINSINEKANFFFIGCPSFKKEILIHLKKTNIRHLICSFETATKLFPNRMKSQNENSYFEYLFLSSNAVDWEVLQKIKKNSLIKPNDLIFIDYLRFKLLFYGFLLENKEVFNNQHSLRKFLQQLNIRFISLKSRNPNKYILTFNYALKFEINKDTFILGLEKITYSDYSYETFIPKSTMKITGDFLKNNSIEAEEEIILDKFNIF